MSDESLPAELAEIERQLFAARRTESVVHLRSRVLGGVHEQLRRDRRQKAWNFVATLAASALVWVNVSLSISGLTDYPNERTNRSAEVASWTAEVGALLPEVSDSDATRLALILRSGSHLAQCPTIQSSTSLCLSECVNQQL